jgi:hypothetical protein
MNTVKSLAAAAVLAVCIAGSAAFEPPVPMSQLLSGDEATGKYGIPEALTFNLPIFEDRARLLHEQMRAASAKIS